MKKHSFNYSLKDINGEVWVKLERLNFEYEVSNFGRLKSIYRERGNRVYETVIKKQRKDKDGYLRSHTCSNNKTVDVRIHRLVAEAFIPNPDNKRMVNHKNGIVWDNRVENLEWATHMENTIHAIRNGLTRKPGGVEKTLTEDDVLRIFNSNEKMKLLSNMYNVCYQSVRQIKSGEKWGWLTGKKYIPKDGARKYILVDGEALTHSQLAKRIGAAPSTITYRLKKGWSIDKILGVKPKKDGVIRVEDYNSSERVYSKKLY